MMVEAGKKIHLIITRQKDAQSSSYTEEFHGSLSPEYEYYLCVNGNSKKPC